MTKYLDENGLAYFWTKIKAWLSSHAPVKYFGQNWVEDTNNDYALVVGNGADENNPKNAMSISDNGNINIFINEIDENSTPVSSQARHLIEGYSNLQEGVGFLEIYDGDDGYRGVGIKAHRLVNNVHTFHGVQMQIDSTGRKKVDFDHEDGKLAWQEALQPYSELFSIYDPDVDFTKANNNISGLDHWPAVVITDQNGKVGARFESFIQTTGPAGFAIYGKNYDTSGNDLGGIGFRGTFDKNGNPIWRVDFPAEFRNSIGASSGIWPISLGGSGNSGVLYTYNPSDFFEAASGITIVGGWAARWGKCCSITIEHKKTSAISVPANGDCTDILLGTLKAGFRPRDYLGGLRSYNNNPFVSIRPNGQVYITGYESTGAAYTIPANYQRMMSASFVLA